MGQPWNSASSRSDTSSGFLPRMIIARTSSLVTSFLLTVPTSSPGEHHADPVGEVEHVVDVVADEEDPDALRLQLGDELVHLPGLGRTEGCGGLVHDQDAGVEVDGAGDGHRLALPARQPSDRGLEVGEPRVEPAHDLACRRRHRRVVERAGAGQHLAAEEHVRRGVDVVGEGEGLVDRLDAAAPWRRGGC